MKFFFAYGSKTLFHKKGFELSLVLKMSFWNLEMVYFMVIVFINWRLGV